VDPRAGLQVWKETELLLSRESNDDPSLVISSPVAAVRLCRGTADTLPPLSTVIGIPIDDGR
jgi:hypothetical protein